MDTDANEDLGFEFVHNSSIVQYYAGLRRLRQEQAERMRLAAMGQAADDQGQRDADVIPY